MGKKKYTLYLDESTTRFGPYGEPYFCMAGIIVKDEDYQIIQTALDNLKKDIWGDLSNPENIILHQMNITNASKNQLNFTKYPEYQRFRAKNFRRGFNRKFAQMYDTGKMQIIGGCIREKSLNQAFSITYSVQGNTMYRNNPDRYLIALQFLLENYCQFLCSHNGTGRVIYEYITEEENEKIRDRFYHIKLMGSMYITKEAMGKHLLGLDFVKKEENNAGLQIADFIPNTFARYFAGFNPIDNDDTLLNKMKYYRYNGGSVANNPDRFGIKFMP